VIYTIVMYFLACLVDLITAKRMGGDEKVCWTKTHIRSKSVPQIGG
jgi:hypothetical protein